MAARMTIKCKGCPRKISGVGAKGRRALYCHKCHPPSLLNRWKEKQQRKLKRAAAKAKARAAARASAKGKS
jgi:hypothetical protein